MDRGSEPAIDADSFDRPLPTNCNDTDFNETSTTLTPREGEITDMSFALVCLEAAAIILQCSSPELRHSTASTTASPSPSQPPAWQRRLELANAFSRNIDSKVLRFCDPSIPVQRLLIAVGKAAANSMVLRAVRPLQPLQLHTSAAATAASLPRVNTLWVLQLAVVLLQHCKDMVDDAVTADCWRRMPWVPWHAIAVALAGLCSVRGSALADEAWRLVDGAMPRHAADVADTRTGMLWKPIEKLRRKAAAFRDEGRRSSLQQSQSQPQPQQQEQRPQQQQQQQPEQQLQPQFSFVQNMTFAAPFAGKGSAPPPLQQQKQQPRQQVETAAAPTMGFATGQLAPMDIDIQAAAMAAPTVAGSTTESSYLDFPPDMLSTVPDETSWLDWETIMKDMEELQNTDQMIA